MKNFIVQSFLGLMQKQAQTNLINSYGLLEFNYMFYGLLEVLGPSPTSSPTYTLCSKSANPRLSPITNIISFLGFM